MSNLALSTRHRCDNRPRQRCVDASALEGMRFMARPVYIFDKLPLVSP